MVCSNTHHYCLDQKYGRSFADMACSRCWIEVVEMITNMLNFNNGEDIVKPVNDVHTND